MEAVQDDAREILSGKAYNWRDWSICRGRDCLYVWSDAAALELSNGSNGWFRFILDGKLATMYSSGSPEGGSDSTGKMNYFLSSYYNYNICSIQLLYKCKSSHITFVVQIYVFVYYIYLMCTSGIFVLKILITAWKVISFFVATNYFLFVPQMTVFLLCQ